VGFHSQTTPHICLHSKLTSATLYPHTLSTSLFSPLLRADFHFPFSCSAFQFQVMTPSLLSLLLLNVFDFLCTSEATTVSTNLSYGNHQMEEYSQFLLANGVALTPPMGWNSWNHFQCNVDEHMVKSTEMDYLAQAATAAVVIILEITLLFREMDYLAISATVALIIIAFYMPFLGSSDHSNDDTSSPQSDSTPDSVNSDSDSDSVPLPIGEYEVFLNFRGPDTRDSITNILYRFLARSKIRTFSDDEELRKGEGIWPNLVKAIGQSKISVTILSPRYAESKWCLKELVEIVEHKKREKGHIILPIFYMVDPRDSGFEALSNAIVDTAAGLPLTLKVIGSLLYQEEKVVWNDKLEQLRKIPEKVVTKRLKIGYDGLRYEAQQIFLDIACFYIGESKEFPSYMWSGCNFHPISNVNILVQRSMLNIGDDSKFLMHDQLRDMGREIVRTEDIERPWMRSRIWSKEEAHELLLNNKGTNQIKSIRLDSASDLFPVRSSCFTDMSELRYFAGTRNSLSGNFNQVLPNLKWMELGNYPSFFDEANYPSLPTFSVKNLIVFIVSSPGDEITNNIKEANKLKVLILSGCPHKCELMRKLPEFPEFGSLEILKIHDFYNSEEDLKIEKLLNLRVLKLRFCEIGKIKGGTIGTVMKGLQELQFSQIYCDYDTFRQTIVDIEKLTSLQILNVQSPHLVDVLEGIKLPKSLKKLRTSSDFANVEELLELEEFSIWNGTKLVIPPAAGSSRGGDTTSSTIIPWIHSSKLKWMELLGMKRIIMAESKDITMLPSSLTELTICGVDSELIPNLKNLRNLTDLELTECPNLEEVQGIGGLKSLQTLCIVGAQKLTSIHGLGNLMSCSSCKLTELEISKCPVLREVVAFEKQDDDGGGDGDGDDEDFLVKMEILEISFIGGGPTPRLSKLPMVKYMKISELTIVLKGTENTEDLSERKPLLSFLSKLNKRWSYLVLKDVPALLEEIVGAGDMKELCLIMNDCLSLERLHINDQPYSSL
ncbi:Disease resistance protein L6, partial [Linum perenne]